MGKRLLEMFSPDREGVASASDFSEISVSSCWAQAREGGGIGEADVEAWREAQAAAHPAPRSESGVVPPRVAVPAAFFQLAPRADAPLPLPVEHGVDALPV